MCDMDPRDRPGKLPVVIWKLNTLLLLNTIARWQYVNCKIRENKTRKWLLPVKAWASPINQPTVAFFLQLFWILSSKWKDERERRIDARARKNNCDVGEKPRITITCSLTSWFFADSRWSLTDHEIGRGAVGCRHCQVVANDAIKQRGRYVHWAFATGRRSRRPSSWKWRHFRASSLLWRRPL